MKFLDSEIIYSDLVEICNSRNIPFHLLKNKTILITGAYGMLASYFVYTLIFLNEFYDFNIKIVLIIRNLEKYKARFKNYSNKNYISVLTQNINNKIEYEDPIDYIIHAASFASPQYYSAQPVDVILPNVLGTYNLLELAKEKQTKSFLLFSTGDIYGRVENIADIKESSMGTMDPLDIHSCYGESKRLAETLCFSYTSQYGISTKIARIWHTFSPTMNIYEDPRVFSSFIKCLYEGKDIEILSDGEGKRSFLYITDAIRAYFLILLKGENANAYNVCNSSEFLKIKDFAQLVAQTDKRKLLNVKFKKREVNSNYLENNNSTYSRPSNDKLLKLGWTVDVSVEEGINRVYQYLVKLSHK